MDTDIDCACVLENPAIQFYYDFKIVKMHFLACIVKMHFLACEKTQPGGKGNVEDS